MGSEKTGSSGTDSASGVAEMLSSILAHPEMIGQIKEMLAPDGKITEENEQQVPQHRETGIPPDGLSGVLSDPAFLAKLPQVMGMIAPLLTASGATGAETAMREKSQEDYRNDLLLALKPFLSPERRKTVDTILQIAQFGNVIRQIR